MPRVARVVVSAYCLMANHVHPVLTPRTADGLNLAAGRTHGRYDQSDGLAVDRLTPPLTSSCESHNTASSSR